MNKKPVYPVVAPLTQCQCDRPFPDAQGHERGPRECLKCGKPIRPKQREQ